MPDPVQRPVIEDLETGPHAAVSATGTHVMALAAGAVAIVALVASIATGSTIIPVASLSEGDRTTATVTATPQHIVVFARDGTQASPELVVVASPDRPAAVPPNFIRVGGSPSCSDPARSPMEVVYRMFDLVASGPAGAVTACWTPGRAPADPVLKTYFQARPPVKLTVDNVAMQFANGQLTAVVTMRGWWRDGPPMGWADGKPTLVTLRQQPGDRWTIDTVTEQAP